MSFQSLPTNITPIYRALIQLATNYSSFSPQHQVIHLCSAFAIIAEHLYIICNKTERIKIDYISSSITLFYQSPVCAAVTAQIEEASTIYSTSIAEFHSSTWLKVTSSLPVKQGRRRMKLRMLLWRDYMTLCWTIG
ncbi:hypothetical protein BDZ94DRAFT_867557 [Collybia nuda]|uniref:Uncharacterized protein n=1 Tax=Collybia nuda TaxID=64659 RepID=A0A9P5Y084_9AGAR|nr:hypothetical protein BDZ94DRAFT_867557 [Collybia nuda]